MPAREHARSAIAPAARAWWPAIIAALTLAIAGASLAACSDSPDGEPAATADQPVVPLDPDAVVVEVRELSDWYRAVLVNRDALRDVRALEGLARSICEGLTVCRVGFWSNPEMTPEAMPVAERQLREELYSFGRTAAGVESSLWNCNVYPAFEAQHLCLPRTIPQ